MNSISQQRMLQPKRTSSDTLAFFGFITRFFRFFRHLASKKGFS